MQNGNLVEYTRSNPEVNRLLLVSPLTPPPSTNSALTAPNVLQLSEVMSGAAYLHELGVVHGDPKGVLPNILALFRPTDQLGRRTYSLTTAVSLDLQTLVSC